MTTSPENTFSYTFHVLDSDDSVFGSGCFTFTSRSGEHSLQHTRGDTPADAALTAFWYRDPVVGVLDLSTLMTLRFSNVEGCREFHFNAWNVPECSCGLVAGIATPDQTGAVSAHRGALEDASCQGRRLAWPEPGKPREEIIEAEEVAVPLVDLIVVIDTSASMRDEAVALDTAVAAAIDGARGHCPSELRVMYLGIEGTFHNTRFDQTVRHYLTTTCNTDESSLRARKRGTVAEGGAQEDNARVIEDLCDYFDWRPQAGRAIFILGDESLEGGNQDGKQDQADIDAANRAIVRARAAGVRVHTYLGTSSVRAQVRQEIESEYARLARETGGQTFTSQDALQGFQALLQQVICASKPAPRIILHPFCCCQQYVEAS